MSGGKSYQGKSYQGKLDLKLIIRYEGLKATQYFSKFTPDSYIVLRGDLTALKLPHPKQEKTTFISYGCVECVWPLVPKNGVRGHSSTYLGCQRRLTENHSQILHKQVMTRTRPADKQAFRTLLGQLSMYFIFLLGYEDAVSDTMKHLVRPLLPKRCEKTIRRNSFVAMIHTFLVIIPMLENDGRI